MIKPLLPLTVGILTYNEEPNIAAALKSVVGWASEIIVVDSFSTDKTVDIINSFYNIKMYQRAFFNHGDQKNWLIPKAKNEWILLLDADERVTSAMQSEINNIIMEQAFSSEKVPVSGQFDAYWIGFTHYFMGQQVKYSGWQNDKTIRLIKRDLCRYNDNNVHEEIKMEGLRIGRLKAKFKHYTFRNIDHFIAKQAQYATWSAIDYAQKTGKITLFHLILKPFFRFFKHYFLKLGFLDGKAGLVISAVASWSVFLRYVKILENRRLKK